VALWLAIGGLSLLAVALISVGIVAYRRGGLSVSEGELETSVRPTAILRPLAEPIDFFQLDDERIQRMYLQTLPDAIQPNLIETESSESRDREVGAEAHGVKALFKRNRGSRSRAEYPGQESQAVRMVRAVQGAVEAARGVRRIVLGPLGDANILGQAADEFADLLDRFGYELSNDARTAILSSQPREASTLSVDRANELRGSYVSITARFMVQSAPSRIDPEKVLVLSAEHVISDTAMKIVATADGSQVFRTAIPLLLENSHRDITVVGRVIDWNSENGELTVSAIYSYWGGPK
jgi:hypothetical protein